MVFYHTKLVKITEIYYVPLPTQLYLAKEIILCLVDGVCIRVLGDADTCSLLNQLVDSVLAVRPDRHGNGQFPELDGLVEAIQSAMSEVEDSLVVAQDGGLGEEVFGENIVWKDFIRQLSGNSEAS